MDPIIADLQGLGPLLSGSLNVGGLGLITFLFATNRILTRGQHEDRMADQARYHEQVLTIQQSRYDDMKTSRDYHANASGTQRDRADMLSRELSTLAVEASTTAGAIVAAAEDAAREVAGDGRS